MFIHTRGVETQHASAIIRPFRFLIKNGIRPDRFVLGESVSRMGEKYYVSLGKLMPYPTSACFLYASKVPRIRLTLPARFSWTFSDWSSYFTWTRRCRDNVDEIETVRRNLRDPLAMCCKWRSASVDQTLSSGKSAADVSAQAKTLD